MSLSSSSTPGNHLDVLAVMLMLFAVSSIICLGGIIASYIAYTNAFKTFVARLGIRTFIYHAIVLHFRRRDPHVFEHICNLCVLAILCATWVSGAIWSIFYEADIWGYKACRGCSGWELLQQQGDWAVVLEGIILGACLVLCIRSRIRKREAERSQPPSSPTG